MYMYMYMWGRQQWLHVLVQNWRPAVVLQARARRAVQVLSCY